MKKMDWKQRLQCIADVALGEAEKMIERFDLTPDEKKLAEEYIELMSKAIKLFPITP